MNWLRDHWVFVWTASMSAMFFMTDRLRQRSLDAWRKLAIEQADLNLELIEILLEAPIDDATAAKILDLLARTEPKP